jgi:magnesium-transporting ATPase (P-type)
VTRIILLRYVLELIDDIIIIGLTAATIYGFVGRDSEPIPENSQRIYKSVMNVFLCLLLTLVHRLALFFFKFYIILFLSVYSMRLAFSLTQFIYIALIAISTCSFTLKGTEKDILSSPRKEESNYLLMTRPNFGSKPIKKGMVILQRSPHPYYILTPKLKGS